MYDDVCRNEAQRQSMDGVTDGAQRYDADGAYSWLALAHWVGRERRLR